MRFGKICRTAAAISLAATLCGCSVRFGMNDMKRYVSQPKDTSLAKELGVTLGEFNLNYDYYLNYSGITDDEGEAIAPICKQQREQLLETLIFEKITVKKAEEMGVSALTDEEEERARTKGDELYTNMAYYHYKMLGVSEEDEKIETQEEAEKVIFGKFDEYLSELGLTKDYFYEKQKSYTLGYKILEKYSETLDRKPAEDEFISYREDAKKTYESGPLNYEINTAYTLFYIPEGSRNIRHILLEFDDDKAGEIESKRKAGDDAGANAIREEAAAPLLEKAAEIEEKLSSGMDWDSAEKEYSSESVNAVGYLVVPKGEIYAKEFQQTALEIPYVGGRKTCVTDFGVHILYYAAEAKISAEEEKDTIDYLFETYKQETLSKNMSEWRKEMGFADKTDYELLRLDDPAKASASSSGGQ